MQILCECLSLFSLNPLPDFHHIKQKIRDSRAHENRRVDSEEKTSAADKKPTTGANKITS